MTQYFTLYLLCLSNQSGDLIAVIFFSVKHSIIDLDIRYEQAFMT